MSRAQRAGGAVAVLGRPDVVLQAVPWGSLYVGLVQVALSRGPAGPWGLAGVLGLTAAFLVQSAVLARDPRWASSRRALPMVAVSPHSSLLYSHFLVDPPAPARWLWLLPPVLMIAAYALRRTELVLACVATVAAGLVFLSRWGVDLQARPGLATVAALTWVLPAVLVRRALGNLRQVHEEVARLSARDALTGALNRAGLVSALGRRLRRGEPAHLLVVRLDALEEIRARAGDGPADELLARAAAALTRVHRRDHDVARLDGDELVVVTTHDPQQVAVLLLAAVRRVDGPTDLQAAVGGVRDLPPAGATDALDGLVALARRHASSPAPTIVLAPEHTVPTEPTSASPRSEGPTAGRPAADLAPAVPDGLVRAVAEHTARLRRPADDRLLGLGLVVVAALAVLAPAPAGAVPGARLALVAGCALLAPTGVLLAAGRVGPVALRGGAVALGLVVVVLAQVVAPTPSWRLALLPLLSYPAYLAALTLPPRAAVVLLAGLPVSTGAALALAPPPVAAPVEIGAGITGFGLLIGVLALRIRSARDTVAGAHLLLPGADLPGRAALAEHYRTLAPGAVVGVVAVAGPDPAAAAALVRTASGGAFVARTGVGEVAVVIEGAAAADRVRRRLEREHPGQRLVVGVAEDVVTAGTDVWPLLARAQEDLVRDLATPPASPRRLPEARR